MLFAVQSDELSTQTVYLCAGLVALGAELFNSVTQVGELFSDDFSASRQ